MTGAALDVSAWKFRKPVNASSAGAQQIELDLDVLAHAQPGFADLRVLHGSNQVPYIIQRTSISRAITPAVTATNDAKYPGVQPLDHQAAAIQFAAHAACLCCTNALVSARYDRFTRKLPASAGKPTGRCCGLRYNVDADPGAQNQGIFADAEQRAAE